jgi:hypothetical protein
MIGSGVPRSLAATPLLALFLITGSEPTKISQKSIMIWSLLSGICLLSKAILQCQVANYVWQLDSLAMSKLSNCRNPNTTYR